MYKLYWFTGQPGTGKETLAHLLKSKLEAENSHKKYVIIDGDQIRNLFNMKDYAESPWAQDFYVEQVYNCCRFYHMADVIPIVHMISPFAEQRSRIVKDLKGIEIFVECIQNRGHEHLLQDNYEEPSYLPSHKTININTSYKSNQESFELLLKKL
jgi:adenylylsulfate kinase-like enzyme